MTTTQNQTNKPVAELRDGSLKIAIFQNPKKDGSGVRFSSKLTRSYRDLRFELGSSASYRLTGHVAELLTASTMLELSKEAQQYFVSQMIQRRRDYLSYLQKAWDA